MFPQGILHWLHCHVGNPSEIVCFLRESYIVYFVYTITWETLGVFIVHLTNCQLLEDLVWYL